MNHFLASRPLILFLLSLSLISQGCFFSPVRLAAERVEPVAGIQLFPAAQGVAASRTQNLCRIATTQPKNQAVALMSNRIRQIADATKNAVLNLYVKRATPIRVHVLFVPVPGLPAVNLPGEALGSGFICSSDGYVLTNAHVIRSAAELSGQNAEGERFPLEIVAVDQDRDLALLRIKAEGPFPTLTMAHTEHLAAGDWVVAIGNPLGLHHSVSHGIISQKSRDISKQSKRAKGSIFLQSDAPVNPGNSGGPLLDLSGQVVGVNTAIARDAQGISFTIPTETIETFLEQVHGEIARDRVSGSRHKE